MLNKYKEIQFPEFYLYEEFPLFFVNTVYLLNKWSHRLHTACTQEPSHFKITKNNSVVHSSFRMKVTVTLVALSLKSIVYYY